MNYRLHAGLDFQGSKLDFVDNQKLRRSMMISLIFMAIIIIPHTVAYGQCQIYTMRSGSSIYSCNGGGSGATVALGGSSVNSTYQLIKNGNSAIGDLLQGNGASTLKWTVYEPGTYTVMAYGGNCGGGIQMNGSTVIQNLGAPPTVIINSEDSNYRCLGEGISFTAKNGSGYNWYNNGQQISVSGAVYSPSTAQAGTFTIKVEGRNACNVMQSDQVKLYVGGYPTASIRANSTTTICQNNNVVLQTTSNGNTFQWLRDGQPLPGFTNSTYTASLSGSYTVKAQFINWDCATESAPVVINVLPLPIATISPSGNIPISFGDVNVILKANTGSGYTYQWYANNQPLSGETQARFNAVQPGEFMVRVTDNQGCANTSAVAAINVTNNTNYVHTQIIQVDVIKDGSPVEESDLLNLSLQEKQESVTYYDGLGRPVQSIASKSSPAGNDIVQPVAYDAFNREQFVYLPYVSPEANGLFKTDAVPSQNQFYQTATAVAHDTKPFTETIFEASPLNRVIKQGAPGSSWQPDDTDTYASVDHTVKQDYSSNDLDDVYLFTYDPTTKLITGASHYAANQLQVTKTKDEHNNEVLEYVDKEGHTVCKKVQYGVDTNAAPVYAETYYLYNDLGNLVMVVPPEGISQVLTSLTTSH